MAKVSDDKTINPSMEKVLGMGKWQKTEFDDWGLYAWCILRTNNTHDLQFVYLLYFE